MIYFIKDDYYFDVDSNNQFRLTGPENHLLLGFGIEADAPLQILDYDIQADGQIEIDVKIDVARMGFSLPLVCDVRSLRQQIEPVVPRPTYRQLAKKASESLMPKVIEQQQTDVSKTWNFFRNYSDAENREWFYGGSVTFDAAYAVTKRGEMYWVKGESPIKFTIRSYTNIVVENKLSGPLFSHVHSLDARFFNSVMLDLHQELEHHIGHLVRAKKTSSFEYGTIFPRDWLESACLGWGDLDQVTVDYMVQQSLKHVSDEGEGWHEEVIGEYRLQLPDKDHVDRKMIDIEPLYLISLQYVSKLFLFQQDNLAKLRRIAAYIYKNAEQDSLITFKKVGPQLNEYNIIGNWRDSAKAFPLQQTPLAPYDVNCVFYPQSLRVMRDFELLFAPDLGEELSGLIEKWDQNKQRYRMYHPQDLIGYALAVHGKKYLPLSVAHLDESYDLFFGTPSLQEVHSFAYKLVDEEYFYTPSGPMLVAADTPLLDTTNYHGKVIWPKQVAFAVAGLSRQYRRGLREGWSRHILDVVRDSILKTCEACFVAWETLGAVPELYYHDPSTQKAKFYTDQKQVEGQMSVIQLWSAIGARRIMHEYQLFRRNVW